MPEHEVTTLLREAVEAPRHGLDVADLRTRARTRRHQRRTAIGAVVLVLVIVGVGIAAVAPAAERDRDDQRVAVGPSTPAATATTALPPDGVYELGNSFVLEGVPAGFTVVDADPYEEDGPRELVVALESEQHGFVRVFTSFDAGAQGTFTTLRDQPGTSPVWVDVAISGFPTDDGGWYPEAQSFATAAALHAVDGETPSLVVLLTDKDLITIDMPMGTDAATVHVVAQSILDHLRRASNQRPTDDGATAQEGTEATEVFLRWLDAGDNVDAIVAAVEDGEALRETITEALATAPNDPSTYTGSADAVGSAGDHEVITVHFTINGPDGAVVYEADGTAIQVDGEWLVRRETYCQAIAVGPIRCPGDDRDY